MHRELDVTASLHSPTFLNGNGEMARLIRAHDWGATALGAPAQWPQSLRSAVSILLPSRAQICLFWGPQFLTIYNDAYRPTLGVKHPWALGRPAREVWSEFWDDVLHPLLEGVRRTGDAFWASDFSFFLERFGYPEETYFDISYDPVRAEDGDVGGVFCIVSETTGRVLGERRLRTLRDLSAVATAATTTVDALRGAARVLEANPYDVPFALLFEAVEGSAPRLAAAAGIGSAADAGRADATIAAIRSASVPADHAIAALARGWPLEEGLRREVILTGRALEASGPLPRGPWPEPLRQVLVLPMAIAGHPPAGVLVAGVSSRRPLDEGCHGFLRLVASHIAQAAGAARALQEQRARADALAELDRAKSVFFSNVSHEFRTPLTLMLAPLEDLLHRATRGREAPTDAAPHGAASGSDAYRNAAELELVRVAWRNGRRLLKLVNALLDFSRIEAGRMQLAIAPVELGALTADLASGFRSAMDRAGLEFRVDSPAQPALVRVDREAWEKIVLNLLSNAFKYTRRGSVTVVLRQEDDCAVLRVTDTGPGIPARELPHVFERFHRVHVPQARTHEGTGIGLALVQELVKLHGGSIDVESREGEGSTFRVAIPLEPSAGAPAATSDSDAAGGADAPAAARGHCERRHSPILDEVAGWLPVSAADEPAVAPGQSAVGPQSAIDATASPSAVRDAGGAPQGGSIRGHVVLADDNADMRHYVARLLAEDGYAVEAVGDGRAALAAMERRRPDLLLTDVMMPIVDGFALLRAVRSHATLNDVAVVLLSARAGEESVVAGLELGADDYLVKPFSAVELKARVRANVGIARLRRAARERERTLRLEAEAERDRLHAVLAGIRDHFIVLDEAWRLVFVSDSWCALTGLSRQEAVGAVVWELFPAACGSEWEHAARRVVHDREPTHFEFWYEPLGRWWDVRMAPWPQGGLSVLSLDVTDRTRAEVERERLLESERAARADAERATRVKDEFLATLSHELRTPLNAIAGWTHLLQDHAADPAEVQKGLEVIHRNTRLQSQMISDLLDMTRIMSGKLRLNLQPVDLAAVVAAAVDALAPAAEAKHVQVRTCTGDRPLLVRGDPARLQQVVCNLLSNAIKFTPAGGHVEVAVVNRDPRVAITVRDDGQGIAPEFLPHMFERFRQADASAARQHGGLGIGLALVKQLTELHGGHVHAHSDGRGRGATFTIELPLAETAAAADPDLAGEQQESGTPPRDRLERSDLRGLRVLLVDDQPDAIDMVQRLLVERRAEVVAATSAEQALTLLAKQAFDLLLSDIGMPQCDGYAFLAEVRRRGIGTPAVALTAFARDEDRQRALAAGYGAHVAKPVDPGELLATLVNVAQHGGPGGAGLRA